jgi:hypothetical protein
LGKNFDEREKWLKNCFYQSSDVIFHTFIVNETQCAVVYLQGMVNQSLFDENVLKPILSADLAIPKSEFFHRLQAGTYDMHNLPLTFLLSGHFLHDLLPIHLQFSTVAATYKVPDGCPILIPSEVLESI